MRIETGTASAVSAFALAVTVVLGAGRAVGAEDPLAHHRQASRLLVLSAPEADDRRLAEQRAEVDAARTGFSERDLVIVEAIGAGADATSIRRRLSLPADAFRAVLVGKDGGVKMVAQEPIPAQRLFTTIDAMPMRRDEMLRPRP